jgi:hypothetical protein
MFNLHPYFVASMFHNLGWIGVPFIQVCDGKWQSPSPLRQFAQI